MWFEPKRGALRGYPGGAWRRCFEGFTFMVHSGCVWVPRSASKGYLDGVLEGGCFNVLRTQDSNGTRLLPMSWFPDVCDA